MTAEIVVFNREGIAMATDSAVTSSLGYIDKISTSANKLFSLSDKYPVGIMVYGNSSFMDIPWDTIIKVYRSTYLIKKGFPTLDEYAKDFLSFLCYKNINFRNFTEETYIDSFVYELLISIRKNILYIVENSEDEDISKKDLSRIVKQVVDNTHAYYHKLTSSYITLEQSKIIFREKLDAKVFKGHIDAVFNGLPLNKNYRLKVYDLLVEAFSKAILDNVSSGIVFAGFGENEFFPIVRAFKIEGIVRFNQNNTELEILKYLEDEDKSSSYNIDAAVIPYAQIEMVCRFMDGVDPKYREAEDQFLTYLCEDFITKIVSQLDKYDDREKQKISQKLSKYGKNMTVEFSKSMQKFTKERFANDTIEAVARLSKNELASMAEALVYVTSLKRKISSASETVGEPIDVAVISKGDGFVWIRRKHYFEPGLNPIYFMKRNKELINEHYEKPEPPPKSTQ